MKWISTFFRSEEMAVTRFVEVKSKTVLNRYKYRDNWFWNRYGVNPYRGCQFACNYCDAITEKYLVHEHYQDFSRIIYVKKDAPTLLRNELGKAKRDVVALDRSHPELHSTTNHGKAAKREL